MRITHQTESQWQHIYDERARRGGSHSITYGFVSPKTFDYRKSAIRNALSSLPIRLENRWIADIGCGSGLIMLPFLDRNKVVGIDISPEMTRLAKGNGLHAATASALSLPLRTALFDVTIAAGVMQHFRDAGALVRECARITRPGGRVVIETINSESLLRRMYRLIVRGDNLKSRPFRVEEVVHALAAADIFVEMIVHLYYPFTYRKTLVSAGTNLMHRLLASAFIAVGTRG